MPSLIALESSILGNQGWYFFFFAVARYFHGTSVIVSLLLLLATIAGVVVHFVMKSKDGGGGDDDGSGGSGVGFQARRKMAAASPPETDLVAALFQDLYFILGITLAGAALLFGPVAYFTGHKMLFLFFSSVFIGGAVVAVLRGLERADDVKSANSGGGTGGGGGVPPSSVSRSGANLSPPLIVTAVAGSLLGMYLLYLVGTSTSRYRGKSTGIVSTPESRPPGRLPSVPELMGRAQTSGAGLESYNNIHRSYCVYAMLAQAESTVTDDGKILEGGEYTEKIRDMVRRMPAMIRAAAEAGVIRDYEAETEIHGIRDGRSSAGENARLAWVYDMGQKGYKVVLQRFEVQDRDRILAKQKKKKTWAERNLWKGVVLKLIRTLDPHGWLESHPDEVLYVSYEHHRGDRRVRSWNPLGGSVRTTLGHVRFLRSMDRNAWFKPIQTWKHHNLVNRQPAYGPVDFDARLV